MVIDQLIDNQLPTLSRADRILPVTEQSEGSAGAWSAVASLSRTGWCDQRGVGSRAALGRDSRNISDRCDRGRCDLGRRGQHRRFGGLFNRSDRRPELLLELLRRGLEAAQRAPEGLAKLRQTLGTKDQEPDRGDHRKLGQADSKDVHDSGKRRNRTEPAINRRSRSS